MLTAIMMLNVILTAIMFACLYSKKQQKEKVWHCGHYHIDKQIHKINMMCHETRPLHMQLFGDE